MCRGSVNEICEKDIVFLNIYFSQKLRKKIVQKEKTFFFGKRVRQWLIFAPMYFYLQLENRDLRSSSWKSYLQNYLEFFLSKLDNN